MVEEESAIADKLRRHLATIPPRVPAFTKGEIVRLDNGCVGIVEMDTDDEGCTNVFYWEGGEIRGPSYGWELTRLDHL